jgi:hypothetical protein
MIEIRAAKNSKQLFKFRLISIGGNYNEPQFVKVDDVAPLPPETVLNR